MLGSNSHAWVGSIPLGRGSAARALCEKEFVDVVAVPLDTADIPVGSGITFPEWVCAKCRKVKVEKSEERQYAYCIRDSREDRTERQ